MRNYTTIPNVFRLAALPDGNNFNILNNNHHQPPEATISQQQQQQKQPINATTMTTTTQAIVHNGNECSSSFNNFGANDVGIGANGGSNGENVAIRINYPHKLTTIASIEQTPYATLPRGISLNHDGIGLMGNGNLCTSKLPTGVHDERIISTISGSIPSTGYTAHHNQHPSNNNTSNSLDPLGSMASDLNVSLTDFSQLNTSASHNYQQQQQQHYEYNRRLSHKSPFHVNLDRKHDNSYLWILTPVAASISVAIVIAALAGPQWLFTEEKFPNANYNGTANFNALDDGAYLTKYTKSSLWILCTTMQGMETYNCMKIDYFPKEGYQPEPHDSTSAIPYTVRKSSPLFLASGIFLLISFIVYLIPTCSHQNSLYYFSAGIMFIVSGLFMLIGLITYISTLKAEIGSKLRPRSALQPALLRVTYGQSFFLYVFGFVATEFVGVLNIFLYISLQEIGYYSRLPCFTLANLREKIKEGQYNMYKHQYQFHHGPTLADKADGRSGGGGSCGNLVDQKPLPRRMRQVHNKTEWHEEKLQLAGTVGCRKHPHGPDFSARFNNDVERRFYFEKSTSKGNLESMNENLARSLNELYDEATNKTTNATTIHQQQQQFHAQYHSQPQQKQQMQQQQQQQHHQQSNLLQLSNLPQEFPLTRSISTTTELFADSSSHYGNGNGNANYPTTTPTKPTNNNASTSLSSGKVNKAHTSQRTYQDDAEEHEVDRYDGDGDEPQRLCGIKRSSIRRTKDDLFQDFCKRAGVRPKPTNIYYIATAEEEEQEHEEQQFHAIGDNQPAKPLNRNTRRASMFAEPLHVRQFANSNLSLHSSTLYGLDGREPCGAINNNINVRPLYARGIYGGSQTQLPQADCSNSSRTLPRSFLKQHTMQQQQQQPVVMGHLLPPLLTLHKSCEKLNTPYPVVQQTLQQQQQQQLSPQVTVQWPAAIPSSPANFNSAKYQLYSPTPQAPSAVHHVPHALVTRTTSNGATAKFQRAYAFDDQRRPTVLHSETFDLDEMEREHRRSHANLLGVCDTPLNRPTANNSSSTSSNEQYDVINGTAV